MASLLDLHEANPFKVRAYTSTIMGIERLGQQVLELEEKDLTRAGISKGMAPKIISLRETGTMEDLEYLLSSTPKGVIAMLEIKGIGAKKIRAIWKELGVASIDALKDACETGAIASLKGFGEKTQTQILEQLAYLEATAQLLHYSDAEEYALQLKEHLQKELPQAQIAPVGEIARQLEVVATIELIVAHQDFAQIRTVLNGIDEIEAQEAIAGPFIWKGLVKSNQTPVHIHFTQPERLGSELLLHSSSPAHLAYQAKGKSLRQHAIASAHESEASLYNSLELPTVPAPMREGTFELSLLSEGIDLPELVQMTDLKGVLHNHSTYSDGKHTLEEMALHCQSLGYEYLGITDHSQAAFYANGLTADRVKAQHEEIDALNERLAPFRIFKGIESDILNDGSLDYPEEVLASFDFIVSSIHSNLKMDEEKATQRLITAIENPYTTILGHPTGRLLLKREGYPINHQAVIDACAANGVSIEINANPWRLDLDWRWVRYAIDQGVMIAINPDAHDKERYNDMRYGVLIGQKAGLSKEMTLNSLNTAEIEVYFKAKLNCAK